MYIIVFEDGTLAKTDGVSEDLENACIDGFVDIIDISDNEDPKNLWNGRWNEIKDVHKMFMMPWQTRKDTK